MRGTASALIAICLLPGCGDGSGTFALPDGCYYSLEGNVAVLSIRGEEGTIVTAGSDLRSVQVRPRVDQDGAWLEARPAFRLERRDLRAVAEGPGAARFPIEPRDGGQAILAPLSDGGRMELRLGAVCAPGSAR